ncbi:Transmembrane protein 18 [Trypanosoma melophagium]|uniref:Transmembrane protein 18 n=1 Tax=Trypanosoma melophagium TaxID=715481 RepID=UPI00351A8EE8|nr:Transmembrane protein 18 [Trypanosoma melophagium]
MDELWKTLVDAHMEVMNATGWGSLIDSLRASWNGDGNISSVGLLYQNVRAFLDAVNWSEPFFTYLAIFHIVVIIIVAALTWRASTERIFVVDVLVLLLGWCSSYLNDWGRSHAAEIFVEKGVNYFDRDGLFISVVYWIPLFLVALGLQGRIFLNLLQLMVKTKRRQLQREMRERSSATTAKEEKKQN